MCCVIEFGNKPRCQREQAAENKTAHNTQRNNLPIRILGFFQFIRAEQVADDDSD